MISQKQFPIFSTQRILSICNICIPYKIKVFLEKIKKILVILSLLIIINDIRETLNRQSLNNRNPLLFYKMKGAKFQTNAML